MHFNSHVIWSVCKINTTSALIIIPSNKANAMLLLGIVLNLVWHNIFWNVITNWNSSKISNACHGKNIWHSRCVLFLMACFISSGQKGTVSYNHNVASVRPPLFPINDISVHILIIFETTWVIETKHLWNYLSDWNQASLKLLEWL